jgi:hypothetical protein
VATNAADHGLRQVAPSAWAGDRRFGIKEEFFKEWMRQKENMESSSEIRRDHHGLKRNTK